MKNSLSSLGGWLCGMAVIEPIELGLSREQSAAMDKIWP
jgi:hypothetical protein